MPYVRVGFLKISEKTKNYSPFYIDTKVEFNKNNNKIIKETYRLINQLKNLKKTNKIEKILFCISLFDLSCEHSKNKSFEKYKILNSYFLIDL